MRLNTSVFTVLSVILSGLYGCHRQQPDHVQAEMDRPAEIDPAETKKKLTMWSLTLNGKSFAKNHHTWQSGSTVNFQGDAQLVTDEIPKFTFPYLCVALRPLGEKENTDWDGAILRSEARELRGVIIHNKVDETVEVETEYFKPGEYNARLYLLLQDSIGDNFSAYLLAKSTATITAP